MSEAEDEEAPGEDKEIPGEGGIVDLPDVFVEQVILDKDLTFEEASRCLNTLGKDESGVRYAYLMITATDKKLTGIDIILKFQHLLFIDVSGNYLDLDALQVLADMPYLVLLKAERNRIECAALRPIHFLQVLDLNRNIINETCDINQPMLECLSLNYNQIYTAQFDSERLAGLKQLEMRGNHLFDISGSYPASIENLYLAENKITKIVSEDFGALVNLRILHLRDNPLRKLNGFSEVLVNLKYLNLRKNKINKFRQFRKLQCLPNLETLIVLENPVVGYTGEEGAAKGEGDDEAEEVGEDGEPEDISRIPLLVLLPNLKRINKVAVRMEEREEALNTAANRLLEIMDENSSEDEAEIATTTDFTTDYTTDVEPTTIDEDTADDVFR